MRVESPSSPRERRSVSTVCRSIISMRDSNFIKKDEKHIPHFRRTALFTSGGGIPEGKVGAQHSPRDVHSILMLESAATSERVLYEFTYNSETNGDGVKMFNSDECVRVEHLRPHAPSEMWTPALPRPRWFHHVPV